MKTTELSTADPSIWDGGSEPDVPWGPGGIDDWGWTTQATVGNESDPDGTNYLKPDTEPAGRSNP